MAKELRQVHEVGGWFGCWLDVVVAGFTVAFARRS